MKTTMCASTTFTVTIIAPDGELSAVLTLVPGQRYRPDDIDVTSEPADVDAQRTLTVRASRLPTQEAFRVLAARAATRAADDTHDPARQLLNLLIPY